MRKALYLVLALLLALPAGCSGTTAAPESPHDRAPVAASASHGPEPEKELSLDICLGARPKTVDPTLNTSFEGGTLIIHAFEGLMTVNAERAVVPGAAASYTVSDDGLVYTFTLRDDARWSDGQPVKAQDFVYSWQRLVDPATAAAFSYVLDMVMGVADVVYADDPSAVTPEMIRSIGISAPDDKTVRVTLAHRCAYFLEICALPACVPLRRDILVKAGDAWALGPATYIGNGPYKLEAWAAGTGLTYVKNPYYHDLDRLGPAELRFSLLDDADDMLAAYNTGALDMIDDVPSGALAALKAGGALRAEGQLGTCFVSFNTQLFPFDDVRVREAFSRVIDRNAIVEDAAPGQLPAGAIVPVNVSGAEPGTDFREPGGDYYSLAPEEYKASCDEARALLAEAGYPEGRGFPAVEYITTAGEEHLAVAEALQAMWQTELGVTVSVTVTDLDGLIESRLAGSFQLARDGWLGDVNDPAAFLSLFTSDSAVNSPGYSSPDFDALMAQAAAAGDRTGRMALLHWAEDLLLRDAAVAPLCYTTDLYLINDELQGFYTSPQGLKYFMYVTRG